MERTEPTIEELLNIIKLQESALEYYGNKKNYSGDINKIPILKDRGEQARFILKRSSEIRDFQNKMIENLQKAIDESDNIDLNQIDSEETKKKISTINQIFKGFNL